MLHSLRSKNNVVCLLISVNMSELLHPCSTASHLHEIYALNKKKAIICKLPCMLFSCTQTWFNIQLNFLANIFVHAGWLCIGIGPVQCDYKLSIFCISKNCSHDLAIFLWFAIMFLFVIFITALNCLKVFLLMCARKCLCYTTAELKSE